jgi:predicted phage tail component-like protein
VYQITRNGKNNTHVGILVANRPSIPAPEYSYNEIDIPGRDGNLYEEIGNINDITISISFVFICDPSKWQDRFRNAKRWLLEKKDNKLILGDDAGYFYKVKHTIINASERKVIESGEFDVDFICEGYNYLIEGQNKKSIKDVLYNPYAVCHPTYLITGEGRCTLNVNGRIMTANVGQNLTINTDLMLAYRTDGTMQNTAITGDYEEMYLKEGDNTISLSNGFNIKIIPNWRCL